MNIVCRFTFGCTLVFIFSVGPFGQLGLGQLRAQEENGGFDPCGDLRFTPIQDIETRLPEDDGRLPPDCSGRYFQARVAGDARRFDTLMPFQWQPTNFFHLPVYFDDVPLERYGQTRHAHFEPVLSGAKFALALPVLPYRMGLDRPHDCVTTLGHLPPGDCVPCIHQTLPLAWDAALFEAATAVGLVFLLP